jgi:hypothetical protein
MRTRQGRVPKLFIRSSFAILVVLTVLRLTGCDRIYSKGIVASESNDARRRLGRWPVSWEEVESLRDGDAYSKVRAVEYSPLPDGRCAVKVKGRNFYLAWVTDDFIIERF